MVLRLNKTTCKKFTDRPTVEMTNNRSLHSRFGVREKTTFPKPVPSSRVRPTLVTLTVVYVKQTERLRQQVHT